MKTEKILNIVLAVLMAISAFLIISLYANISDATDDPGLSAWLNTNLTWMYILLIVTIVTVVLFSVIQTFTNKEAAKRGLVTLGAAVAVVLVSYLLSADELPRFFGVERFIEDGTLTLSVSKWIDTLLYVSYILLGGVIAVTMFWSVTRIFKK